MVNKIFSLVIIIMAIVLFIESRSFSENTGMQTFAPSFFPTIIITIMSLLALVLFISSLKEKDSVNSLIKSLIRYSTEHWRVIALIVLLFIYLIVLPISGFLLSTVLFLLAAFTLLRPIKKQFIITNVLISFILPMTIQWIFQNILNIYLP